MSKALLASGGVSPRNTRLRGQSIIEYVLIAAVFGLVVVFAGPQVSGAIRNQLDTVTDTLDDGTVGENFYDATELPDPENGTAFAIYSEDDRSLMFYKRRGVPKVGDMFNDRRVTAVYTGFENQTPGNLPMNYEAGDWHEYKTAIQAVSVVDSGIKPAWIESWFQNFQNCDNFALSLLETGDVTSLEHIFYNCSTVRSIDLSGWDFSSSLTSTSMFAFCDRLEHIDFGDWVPDKLSAYGYMFDRCLSLSLDCSNWAVPLRAPHDGFNHFAPGVILPKAWQ